MKSTTAPRPPLALGEPFPLGEPLDYEDARVGLEKLARARRVAREQYEQALLDVADVRREFRKGRAQAYVVVEGSNADERKAKVDDRTRDLAFQCDIAEGMIKGALERLKQIDAERASLHRLLDGSMRNPAGAEGELARSAA